MTPRFATRARVRGLSGISLAPCLPVYQSGLLSRKEEQELVQLAAELASLGRALLEEGVVAACGGAAVLATILSGASRPATKSDSYGITD